MSQSNELTKFYQAYSDWLDAGAPHRQPFWRNFGLCSSINDVKNLNVSAHVLMDEMSTQFIFAGLNRVHPFGQRIYMEEKAANEMHLNPRRIAWVKSQLNQGENNE